MSSLLNNASLLFNPAGSIISYQEDKIYSVLPRNGAGDFTFSGGDGGTRVNQQGYIEQTPANLVTYSEDFTNGWVVNATITSNTIANPLNGLVTADTITGNGYIGRQVSSIGVNCWSVYAKEASTNTIRLNVYDGITDRGATYNLNTGAISSIYGSPISTNSENIGDGWWRISITTNNVNYSNVQIHRDSIASVYIYGAMLNIGSTAKPYQPTTDRLNYPRITYQNGRGALLQEPQRTNYIANNQTSSAWNVGTFSNSGTILGFPAVSVTANYSLGDAPHINGPSLPGNGYYTDSIFVDFSNSPNYGRLYLGPDQVTLRVAGPQYETGEFATSLIPTYGSSVTRPMDQFFNNDSPALSSTSWTFYMSGVNIGKNQNSSNNNIDNVNWSFDSGAGPYGPNSLHNYNNTIYYYDTVNGPANLGDIGSTTTKFAVTKNGTTFKLFRDGVLFSTNVLSLASNVWDSFRMYGTTDAQGQAFSNNPSTLAILPSALSDAEAQSLTTVRSGSGGNISYYGPYTIHTFTGSATFTPSFSGEVEVLVVAGGGGGGNNHAGGGGAGGLLYASSYGVSQGTGVTVTIGAGGASPVSNPDPVTNGSNSVFGGLTAIGGGGGGNRNDFNNNSPGGNGGSGGGGGGSQSSFPGNWVPGNGIPGQGNNGGYGIDIYGGGGGGAGAVGTVGAASSAGGNGGNGLPYSISGFSTYYAGGGGGGYCPIAGGGNGGLGGGGKGGILVTDKGTPGVPYTGAGGGGGGAGGTQGSIGGAGIVIVRYLT